MDERTKEPSTGIQNLGKGHNADGQMGLDGAEVCAEGLGLEKSGAPVTGGAPEEVSATGASLDLAAPINKPGVSKLHYRIPRLFYPMVTIVSALVSTRKPQSSHSINQPTFRYVHLKNRLSPARDVTHPMTVVAVSPSHVFSVDKNCFSILIKPRLPKPTYHNINITYQRSQGAVTVGLVDFYRGILILIGAHQLSAFTLWSPIHPLLGTHRLAKAKTSVLNLGKAMGAE
ncbi:hypothetical protein EGW08_019392 [Elysia chlorotica]|uniref:Uncharacterized protein n=1 Tax=Elysia chlorotica TaxID=188477 RepID=A0A433SU84_ELYCH|nr:hypothetical protein EGW08_019392 [Elysia chlorotica]